MQYTIELQKLHAALTDLPMCRENMPYYQGPRIQPQPPSDNNVESLHIQSLLTDILTSRGNMDAYLTNVPVRFRHMHLTNDMPKTMTRKFLTSKIVSHAFQALYFNWAVYSFSNGHVSSTIQSRNLPFHVSLACDTIETGQALFQEFTPDAKVFSTGNNLLTHIRASGNTSVVHGYLINS